MDPRYLALIRKDRSLDGQLWFGVGTTHVFCRPACPCRTPLPQHVEYFESPALALRAGFRPCKRCRPLGVHSAVSLREAVIGTALGDMVAIGNEYGLTLLEFTDRPMLRTQRERVRRLFQSEIVAGDFPAAQQSEEELAQYFTGARQAFTVPVLPLGTPFQRLVWSQLVRVPYGHTTTYDALARRVDRPGAPRAVGRANGDNRLTILFPCHRVIGSDGDLTGYGGGLWRKRALLELEESLPARSLAPA